MLKEILNGIYHSFSHLYINLSWKRFAILWFLFKTLDSVLRHCIAWSVCIINMKFERIDISVNDCCVALQQRGVLQSTGARYEELVSDTKDSFRLFASLEQLLKWPTKFGEQHLYQIDPVTQRNLIERYQFFPDWNDVEICKLSY